MSVYEVRSEIEYIHMHLERVEALHRIMMDNYFCHRDEDLKPDSPVMYGLLINYPDYSAVLDIAHNCIHDINKRLQAVIDTICDKE